MPARYLPSELFQRLFERDPTTVFISPRQVYDPSLTAQITNLKLPDGSDAPGPLLSSLHLLNDDIKSAHDIAEAFYDQNIYDADYQHGLVHIREGDFWNARWWFNRITRTSAPLLVKNFSSQGKVKSAEAAGGAAKEFIAECERVGKGTSEGHRLEQELYKQMKKTAEWSIQEFVEKAE